VVLPIYEGKGDPIECGSYRGIKLLEHAMKAGQLLAHHVPGCLAQCCIAF